MPRYKIAVTDSRRCLAIWHVTEDEKALAEKIAPFEQIPDTILFPSKRLEFAAGRLLAMEAAQALGFEFHGITKDEHGKPGLANTHYKISLSHSFPYVAILVDTEKEVGIDIEQPKEKLLRVAPRVLHASELNDAGEDIQKHCVYWCAKEALLKVHGKRNLTFSENIRVEPFILAQEGTLSGSVIVDITKAITLRYQIHQDFVLVYST